jgi:hypothetical protein
MLIACALCVVPPTLLLAVIVDWYTGHTHAIPITGFGMAFNFAEPAILTDNWKSANIFLATAVALVLLAVWVAVMTLGIRRRLAVGGLIVGLAAVSLFADVQINDHVAEPYNAAQRADVLGLTNTLKPGQPIGVSLSVGYYNWMPQDYEIWWTSPVFFDQTDPPPPGINVVEVPWSPGQAEDATWPTAPQGWRVATADQSAGWVAWEKS